MKALPCILSLLCISTLTASAGTWYVATNGSDANPGVASAPFRTIQKGANMARPGDTVLARQGIYRERVSPPRRGESARPIVYMAKPGKNVVIKGSDVWTPAWEKDGALHYAVPEETMFTDDCYQDDQNRFKVEMSSTPFGRDGKREYERGFVSEPKYKDLVFRLGQVYVDGRLYRQAPLKEEAAQETGTWWYEKATGRIYVHFAGDPSTKTVEITTRRRVFAPHQRGLGNIHVIGFVMEHCGNNYPTNFGEKEHPKWQQAGLLGTRSGHHWLIQGNVFRLDMVGLDVGYESDSRQAPGRPGAGRQWNQQPGWSLP